MKRTIVYIDGFNFYRGLLKGTVCRSFKWLDLWLLFHNLLGPDHQLQKVKYFTADVTADINKNTDKSRRQQAYFRALKTTLNNGVELIKGRYQLQPKHLRLDAKEFNSKDLQKYLRAYRPSNTYAVTLHLPKEKCTDVNLATHLLNDAWLDAFDCAVIVSNDSDLAESLRLVQQQPQLNQELILVTPGEKIQRDDGQPSRTTSKELRQHANKKLVIKKAHLKKAQFPDAIPNTTIRKPPEW